MYIKFILYAVALCILLLDCFFAFFSPFQQYFASTIFAIIAACIYPVSRINLRFKDYFFLVFLFFIFLDIYNIIFFRYFPLWWVYVNVSCGVISLVQYLNFKYN
jgi:hypothetical protein